MMQICSRFRCVVMTGFFVLAGIWTPMYAQTPSPEPTATPPAMEALDAGFAVSTTIPLVGEPFDILLRAEAPEQAEIVEWPSFPDQWGPFEVRQRGEIITRTANGLQIQEQEITAVIWQTGDYSIPDTFVGYSLPRENRVFRVSADTVFMSVRSVLPSQELNSLRLKPSRGPASVFYIPSWLISFTLSGSGILAVVVGEWLKLRRTRQLEDDVEEPLSIEARAIRMLKGIAHSTLTPAETMSYAGDLLRHYLQARYDVPSLEQTTPELIDSLQDQDAMPQAQLDRLWALLEQSDITKYGGTTATTSDTHTLIKSTLYWLREEAEGFGEVEPDG